ncbi:MAG: MFS transporter [Rhodospirillaceae bacterium]
MVDISRTDVKLPLVVAIGWGIGTFVPSIMFNITNVFLMRFMTDVLGIAAVTAGAIFAVSKIYDAMTDPLMGTISDRTRTRWGRHRPYLIFGGIVCGASLIAIFGPPAGVVGSTAAWYMLGALVLYSTGYTIFNVPYLAMPAEMTQNYHERSFLMSWRVVAINCAQIIGLILSPVILVAAGGGREGYAVVGWVMASVVVVAGILSFRMTAKAHFHDVPSGLAPKFFDQLRTVADNKPFLQLLGIKFFMLLANSFSFGGFAYFVQRVIQQPDTVLSYMFMTSTATGLLAIPIWLKVSRKIGKPRTLMIACSILALSGFSWLLATADESLFLILLRPFGTGVAAAGMLIVGQSMLPDTIEYDRRRTGLERAGVFAGIYTTAEKMAYALGPALTGVLLGGMGYVSGTAGAAIEQPASAITAIYLTIGVAPGVCLMAAVGLLFFYDLDEEKLKATAQAA